jgi:gamma-glutamyltranspeptidase/glutathione hydrolase
LILSFAGAVCTSVPAVTSAADRTGKPVPIPPVTSIARSDFGMAATGSPEATEAAVEILERGGNAIDAAVAAALMLGVADPDASGIGGMTYMVIHLAGRGTVVLDGTAPTPQRVNPARLKELKDAKDLFGYAVVAVPTTLAVLERARMRFGTMDMASLVAPSIEVAEHGHRLSPIQIVWTNVYYDHIMTTDYLRFLAFADGETLGQVGDIVCRPDLVRTLRHIARYGVSSFYRGRIADQIEADMIRGGGFLRKSDLASLRIKEVYPLHTTYRGTDVYTVPKPGGGAPVIEALNILETYPSDFLAQDSVERHHVLVESFRIALADRGMAPESPDQLRPEPSPELTKEHARKRAGLITPGEVIPETKLYGPVDPECAPTGESTTQVSVVDRWGNVVSLTQTLGRSYGAEVATPGLGFPYNSLLESFNFGKPQCPGYLQPRIPCFNDMAPTIVLAADGTLLTAVGAPSSNRIPSIITNVISNLVDRKMGLEEAIEAPRVLYGGFRPLIQPSIEILDPIVCTIRRRQRRRLERKRDDLRRCRRRSAVGFSRGCASGGRTQSRALTSPALLWNNDPRNGANYSRWTSGDYSPASKGPRHARHRRGDRCRDSVRILYPPRRRTGAIRARTPVCVRGAFRLRNGVHRFGRGNSSGRPDSRGGW